MVVAFVRYSVLFRAACAPQVFLCVFYQHSILYMQRIEENTQKLYYSFILVNGDRLMQYIGISDGIRPFHQFNMNIRAFGPIGKFVLIRSIIAKFSLETCAKPFLIRALVNDFPCRNRLNQTIR